MFDELVAILTPFAVLGDLLNRLACAGIAIIMMAIVLAIIWWRNRDFVKEMPHQR